MSLDRFHPAVQQWFRSVFAEATPAQRDAWAAIKGGRHTLISAPTGSGKTLAAFMSAIDDLVREDLARGLEDKTYVLYVSPLKALSNDIQKNLQVPLQGIAAQLESGEEEFSLRPPDAPPPGRREIRALVRTGDTPAGERDKMRKKPPHILVTTPESLYILLTSESGRRMLGTVRSVIVDEIHALTGNKRGAHLSLSLERLQGLVQETTGEALTRIGLSATQHPIDKVARFLVGERDEPCTIIDSGHVRDRDLAVEVPGSPLQAVMANEVWEEVHRRLAEMAMDHRTTLVFVNNRRLAERTARHLGELIGDDNVTSHHGSLAREHRLKAEQRLKHGQLRVMVATASLELGIDIGEIDLVCQIGSPRSISALLQRVGRSGHGVGRVPKGRLFPTSRDDLVECAALVDAVRRGEMDVLHVPVAPLDVLAQQVIAEVAGREWDEDALYRQLTAAYPYAQLEHKTFDRLLDMLADGFTTRRGRRSAYLYRDTVNRKLRARKGARLVAITNAGAIPDQFDYDVIMEPESQFVGTLNEDFAFESLPGDIFQLGNTSYRILRVERSVVRVEDARGLPPNIPFWFGEAPGRSDELSMAVSRLRGEMESRLADGLNPAVDWLVTMLQLSGQAAVQLAEYLSASRHALEYLPTRERVIFERFFDEAGDQHLVIHSPYGSRVNRAWGLALRKKFCRKFNFELQAAALEDSIVVSLGATHSFPLEEVKQYVKAGNVRHTVTQAMLQAPLFMTRWRWVTSIALAIQRNRGGKRVPAQFQRMDAEDLIAVVFPDQIACQDNVVGEREIPDHPLVNQTITDCLNDAMDIAGLERLLNDFENGRVEIHCRDLAGPSPLAQEILTARPYAFLDDAPAEERRTQAVAARSFMDPADAAQLAQLDPEAIARVRAQAWPSATTPDELHDALQIAGVIRESETRAYNDDTVSDWPALLERLIAEHRATVLTHGGERYWVAAEKLSLCHVVWPEATNEHDIAPAGPASERRWETQEALVELLRGRLECSGPITESTLGEQLQIDASAVHTALLHLQNEGFVMQGRFSPDLDEAAVEWCERGLLARIHRYTMQRLREAVKPVNTAEFMRFLFEWHGMLEQPAGEQALIDALHKLEGFSAAAAGWESDILPARIAQYSGGDLDRLCTTGLFIWARLVPTGTGGKRHTPVRSTPIALLSRSHAREWFTAVGQHEAEPKLSSNAQAVLDALHRHGASFYADLVHHTGLLRTQVENALGELAAAGIVSSDNFTGLRALIAPANRKPTKARLIRRGMLVNSLDNAGRWSIIRTSAGSASPYPPSPPRERDGERGNEGAHPSKTKTESTRFSIPYETLEYIAQTLLHRYGVVFRKLLTREPYLPPWRELLYVYRRMEARGEIRGGRFVDGFGGEQFALPEAVGLLRQQRHNMNGELIALSAADPLNLAGIILPGDRIPAQTGTRIVFKNGRPVAVQSGKDVRFIGELSSEEAWRARNMLARRMNPAGYAYKAGGLRQ